MNIFRLARQAAAAEWHRAFGRAARPLTTARRPPRPPVQRQAITTSSRANRQRNPGTASPKRLTPISRISKSTRFTRPRPCQSITDYITRLHQLIYCFDEVQTAVDVRDALPARLEELVPSEADKIGRVSKTSFADPDGRIGAAVSRMQRFAGEILVSLDPGTEDGGVPTLPVKLVRQVRNFGDAVKRQALEKVITSLQQAKRDRLLHDTDLVRHRYKPSEAHVADLERQRAALENGQDMPLTRSGEMSAELKVLCESGAEEALKNELILRQLRAVQDPPVIATNEKKYVEWKEQGLEPAVVEASEDLKKRWTDVQTNLANRQAIRIGLTDRSYSIEERRKVRQGAGNRGITNIDYWDQKWVKVRGIAFENLQKAEEGLKAIQDEAMRAGLEPATLGNFGEVDSQILIFDEHAEDDESASVRSSAFSDRLAKRDAWQCWAMQIPPTLAESRMTSEQDSDESSPNWDTSSVPFGNGNSLTGQDVRDAAFPTAARKARMKKWKAHCEALRSDAAAVRDQRRFSVL
ncbi:hypothetical protein CBER1_02027 [Cercospora berteroae]|uniref:Uncharacterized protein n=1 Tax=Cercospora berteroae TaxID=357750 RepID=A0A2S6CMS9_9PEZI|nr:hypothetical protein CBER1_02027 [Cercospora berteroae]